MVVGVIIATVRPSGNKSESEGKILYSDGSNFRGCLFGVSAVPPFRSTFII